MTSNPLVTIVTPAFNQAKFLGETIESVLSQTYSNIEYIVIDDGSSDCTAAVMNGYAGKITAIHQANVGQSLTINRGVAMARGKYVGYLSSDDILYPQAIERLVEILEVDNGVVCAFPDADLIDPKSEVIKRRVCRPFDRADLLIRQECYIGPGALYRTDDARAVGGWRPELRLAPDREFWLRLASRGRFHFLQDSLAGYRTHRGSTSYAEVSEAQSREYLTVLDDFFSDETLPAPIASRKSEAYGYANFLIARNCIRGGSPVRAAAYYRKAVRLHPPLLSASSMITLARSAVSKPVRLIYSKLVRRI